MNFLKKLFHDYQHYQKFLALNKQKLPIGFYSEMGTDRIYFEEIIHRLVEQEHQPVLYLTSSLTDPMMDYNHPRFHPVYIGDGLFRNLAFRDLNVRLFVMTLPDLNSYELKRSIYPVHYVYIFHSLVSTHMVYRDKAFDAYDTIFCVGPHQETEIREAEHVFKLRPKTLISQGYPRIDKITEMYRAYLENASPQIGKSAPHILIAPSWGANSITNLCIHPLIQHLLNAGFEVTFRPHPMTHRDEPHRLEAVKQEFRENKHFHFDDDIAQVDSLFQCDAMISEWSGVALEFALVTEKPVLYIDTPPKCNNPKFDKFSAVPIEMSLRAELGEIISLQQLEQVPRVLTEMLSTRERRKESIASIRKQLIYNIGRSSEVGATEIMKLLSELSSGLDSKEKQSIKVGV